MGHVTKRKGRWQATYRGPDSRERTRTFTRKVDAEHWLATQDIAKATGGWVDPRAARIAFGDYASEWLATKADVAPRTFINVEGRLRNHVLPFFGEIPFGSIRPTHVRSWVAGLVATGMAPSTIKATYQTASQVFQQAVIDGLIAKSPCQGVPLPRERQHQEMLFLNPDQVNILADALNPRYRALIYTAAYGGLRAGELEALKVERLHLLAGTINVIESLSEARGRLVCGPTKTGRPRTVPLPRFLTQMLGEHIGEYPSTAGYVFSAAEGGPIRHRNLMNRHFKPAVRRTPGLPDELRFHDLRHTCAALLIANGRHMEEVKEHLGHSSIRVTSDRYGHLFPKARRALAEGLETTFREAAPATVADFSRTGAPLVPFPDTANRHI